MCFTQVTEQLVFCLFPRSAVSSDDGIIGCGLDSYGLLHKAEEQLAPARVEIQPDSALEADAPKPLLAARAAVATSGVSRRTYPVTVDGQRFLIITPAEETATSPITVVVNWAVELRR